MQKFLKYQRDYCSGAIDRGAQKDICFQGIGFLWITSAEIRRPVHELAGATSRYGTRRHAAPVLLALRCGKGSLRKHLVHPIVFRGPITGKRRLRKPWAVARSAILKIAQHLGQRHVGQLPARARTLKKELSWPGIECPRLLPGSVDSVAARVPRAHCRSFMRSGGIAQSAFF